MCPLPKRNSLLNEKSKPTLQAFLLFGTVGAAQTCVDAFRGWNERWSRLPEKGNRFYQHQRCMTIITGPTRLDPIDASIESELSMDSLL